MSRGNNNIVSRIPLILSQDWQTTSNDKGAYDKHRVTYRKEFDNNPPSVVISGLGDSKDRMSIPAQFTRRYLESTKGAEGARRLDQWS